MDSSSYKSSPTSEDLLLSIEKEKVELMKLKKDLDNYKLKSKRLMNRQQRIIDGQEWENALSNLKQVSQTKLDKLGLREVKSTLSFKMGGSKESLKLRHKGSGLGLLSTSTATLHVAVASEYQNIEDNVDVQQEVTQEESEKMEEAKEGWSPSSLKLESEQNDSPALQYITLPTPNLSTSDTTPSQPDPSSPSDYNSDIEPSLPLLRSRPKVSALNVKFHSRHTIAVDHSSQLNSSSSDNLGEAVGRHLGSDSRVRAPSLPTSPQNREYKSLRLDLEMEEQSGNSSSSWSSRSEHYIDITNSVLGSDQSSETSSLSDSLYEDLSEADDFLSIHSQISNLDRDESSPELDNQGLDTQLDASIGEDVSLSEGIVNDRGLSSSSTINVPSLMIGESKLKMTSNTEVVVNEEQSSLKEIDQPEVNDLSYLEHIGSSLQQEDSPIHQSITMSSDDDDDKHCSNRSYRSLYLDDELALEDDQENLLSPTLTNSPLNQIDTTVCQPTLHIDVRNDSENSESEEEPNAFDDVGPSDYIIKTIQQRASSSRLSVITNSTYRSCDNLTNQSDLSDGGEDFDHDGLLGSIHTGDFDVESGDGQEEFLEGGDSLEGVDGSGDRYQWKQELDEVSASEDNEECIESDDQPLAQAIASPPLHSLHSNPGSSLGMNFHSLPAPSTSTSPTTKFQLSMRLNKLVQDPQTGSARSSMNPIMLFKEDLSRRESKDSYSTQHTWTEGSQRSSYGVHKEGFHRVPLILDVDDVKDDASGSPCRNPFAYAVAEDYHNQRISQVSSQPSLEIPIRSTARTIPKIQQIQPLGSIQTRSLQQSGDSPKLSPLNGYIPSPVIQLAAEVEDHQRNESLSSLHEMMFRNAFNQKDSSGLDQALNGVTPEFNTKKHTNLNSIENQPQAEGNYYQVENGDETVTPKRLKDRMNYLPHVEKSSLLNDVLSIFDQTSEALDEKAEEGSVSSVNTNQTEHRSAEEKIGLVSRVLGDQSNERAGPALPHRVGNSGKVEEQKQSLSPTNQLNVVKQPSSQHPQQDMGGYRTLEGITEEPDTITKPTPFTLISSYDTPPSSSSPARTNRRNRRHPPPPPHFRIPSSYDAADEPGAIQLTQSDPSFQDFGSKGMGGGRFGSLFSKSSSGQSIRDKLRKFGSTSSVKQMANMEHFRPNPIDNNVITTNQSHQPIRKETPTKPLFKKLKNILRIKPPSQPNSFGAYRLFEFGESRPNPIIASGHDISAKLLASKNAYVLECDGQIFLWFGSMATDYRQREASKFAGGLLKSTKLDGINSRSIRVEFEGSEAQMFKDKFPDWDYIEEVNDSVTELISNKTVLRPRFEDVYHKVNEDPLIGLDECQFVSLKVWLMRGNDDHYELGELEHGVFYSSESYVLLYHYKDTYHQDRHVVFYWIGRHSKRAKETILPPSKVALDDNTEALMVQILQGREPDLFYRLFNNVVIVRWGSRKVASPNGPQGPIYHHAPQDKVLYHVRGLKASTVRVEQTACDPKYLCSGHSFILISKGKVYVWHGIGSFLFERISALMAAKRLAPIGEPVMEVREKLEPKKFFSHFGERTEYADALQWARKPFLLGQYRVRLFELNLDVAYGVTLKEQVPFHQADLSPTKVFLLDTFFDLFLWTKYETPNQTLEQVSTKYPNQQQLVSYLNLAMEYTTFVNSTEQRPFKLKPIIVTPDHEPLEFIAQFPAWHRGFDPARGGVKFKPMTLRRKANNQPLPVEYLLGRMNTVNNDVQRNMGSLGYSARGSAFSTMNNTLRSGAQDQLRSYVSR